MPDIQIPDTPIAMIPTDFVNDTMVSNECLEAVGFFKARRRFPDITGTGSHVLQVEWDLGSGWSSPLADEIRGTPKHGHHSNEVAKVIKLIAPSCRLVQMEEKAYFNTLSNPRWFTLFGIPTWVPQPSDWDIENHSYTGSRSTTDVKTCEAMDLRIQRDGVIAVASSGNDPTQVRGLWHRSDLTLKIGTLHSPSGLFSRGTSRPPVPYPDRVVPAQWTSIAAPVFSACLALCVEAADGDRAQALEVLLTYGRVDHAIAALLWEPLEEPVVVPPPPPPPPEPPPPPARTRAELLEEALEALGANSAERELAHSIDRAIGDAIVVDVRDELKIHWSAPGGLVTLAF